MNKISRFFTLTVLLLSIFSISTIALGPPMNELGVDANWWSSNVVTPVTNFIEGLAIQTITLPGQKFFEGSSLNFGEVSFLMVVLTFMIFMAVLDAGARKIKVFQEHSGSRKMFSVALALMVTFFSPVAGMLQKLLAGSSNLMVIAYVLAGILGLWFIINLFWKGAGATSAMGASGTRDFATAKQSLGESKNMNLAVKKEARERKNAKDLLLTEKNSINKLKEFSKKDLSKIDDELKRLKELRNAVKSAENVSKDSPQAQELIQRYMNDATNILNIEGSQDAINDQLRNILATLETFDHKTFTALKLEYNQENVIKSLIPKGKERSKHYEDKAKGLIANAESYVVAMNKLIKKAEGVVNDGTQYISQVETETNNVRRALQAVDFPKATELLNALINLVQKERDHFTELFGLIRLLGREDLKAFNLVRNAGSNVEEGEKEAGEKKAGDQLELDL